jgi:hypothetical protein
MVCLYNLFIQLVDMAKAFYGIRFEPSLHNSFKAMALASSCTVTRAFERFIRSCGIHEDFI